MCGYKSFVRVSAVLLAALMLSACRKKLFEPTWQTKILSPIAYSKLNIRDLTQNSSLLQSDSSQLLHIVYTDELYRYENPLDSLVKLQVEGFKKNVKLDSLKLENQNVSNSIILGDIIKKLPFVPSEGTQINAFFVALINAVLASQSDLSNDIDISEFLEEAVLQNGQLILKITNNTPFNIENLAFQVKNTLDNEVIYENIISLIVPKQTYIDSANIALALDGKPVKGQMTLSSGGYTLALPADIQSVKLNYADNIQFSASLIDLKVFSAKAQFPAQNIINYTDTVQLKTENKVELTFAIIDSGVVNVKGFSTVPTDIHFTYSVPNITKNGQQFAFSNVIDQTYNSEQNAGDTNFYFNDYDFDFRVNTILMGQNGKPKSIIAPSNAFLNTLLASIEQSNEIVDISLEDSISVILSIPKIKPSYAEGYLGRDTALIKQTIQIDAFKNIEGNLDFEEVAIQLNVANDIGINGLMLIQTLTARNTKTGQTSTYSGNKGPFFIQPATGNRFGFVSTNSVFELNNAADLLSILPNEIDLDMIVEYNTNPNDGTYSNFIHSGANIVASLAINVPLYASIEALVLKDTSAIDFSKTTIPSGIETATLHLVVTNGFPIDAKLDVYIVNDQNVVLLDLSNSQTIAAAPLDFASKKAISNTKTTLAYSLDSEDFGLLKYGSKMIVAAKFDTPSLQSVKFYEDYTFDIQLVADFGYQTNKD